MDDFGIMSPKADKQCMVFFLKFDKKYMLSRVDMKDFLIQLE